MDLHLTTNDDNAVKWFTKINMKGCNMINGLYLIEMYKKEIVYDKPIYVGTSILDLSKLCMMKFHYEVMDKEFKGRYNLIYSDTDSLVYNIRCDDIYKWIGDNKQHFDLSDSLRPSLQDDTNKKVMGVFKCELLLMIMTEWIALNPKCYSFNYFKDVDNTIIKNKKTCKGVSKAIVKNEITYNDYLVTMKTNKPLKRNVVAIRSLKHQLYTIKTNKVALTSYYDKLKMIDSINCVPYGFEGDINI